MSANSSGKPWIARTTRRKRVATICAVIGIIWFPILVFSAVMFESRTYGPYSGEVETFGVFEPGGFIEFHVNPTYSIGGYYHATVLVTPELGDDIQETTSQWPAVEKEMNFGWPWGGRIYEVGQASHEIPFDFVVSIDIPDDSSLSGQNVTIMFEATIVRPVKVSEKSFVDRGTSIDEVFYILIGDRGQTVSVWEGGWLPPCFLSWLILCLPWSVFSLGFIYAPKVFIRKPRLSSH